MLVILPFEKDFYKKHQVDVHFVGHPLLDATSTSQFSVENFKGKTVLTEKKLLHFYRFSQSRK